jgi:hypothetical protein
MYIYFGDFWTQLLLRFNWGRCHRKLWFQGFDLQEWTSMEDITLNNGGHLGNVNCGWNFAAGSIRDFSRVVWMKLFCWCSSFPNSWCCSSRFYGIHNMEHPITFWYRPYWLPLASCSCAEGEPIGLLLFGLRGQTLSQSPTSTMVSGRCCKRYGGKDDGWVSSINVVILSDICDGNTHP